MSKETPRAQDTTHISEYSSRYNMTDVQKYWKVAIMYKKLVRKLVKLFKGK